MFGYIRPFKPHLRMCEYDTYKAVYCGLCKELGKNHGFMSRMTLSYDFTFVALLSLSLSDKNISISNQSCIAHPLKKSPCMSCGSDDLDYTASIAIISIYHKLKDDLHDKGFKNKFISICMLPFIKGSYKKAKLKYPKLCQIVEENMQLQFKIEKENCKSIDKAAEPTSSIMSAMAEGISENIQEKRILNRLGYLFGRYIYICDALDDVKKDYKEHSYNPFLLQDGCINEDNTLNMDIIKGIASDSINFTLGEIANAYSLLETKKYKAILDNIIFLGLKNTFAMLYNEKELSK